MHSIVSAAETFQDEMSSLNACIPEKILEKSVTSDTIHTLIGHPCICAILSESSAVGTWTEGTNV